MSKPLCFLLIATAMGIGPSALAQITYEFADLPVIGDQVTRYRDTMTVYGPGPAGAGQTWSFPSPVTHETLTTSVIAPSSTPYSSQFSGSNMAMTNDNAGYLYFNVNSSIMEATGAAGDLLQNGGNIVTVFNPRLTVHSFPRTYNSTGIDNYYFEVITTDHGIPLIHSVRLRHRGTVYDTTDGYGQIITPVGTYECLRVKSTDFTIDSVWTRLCGFCPWTLAADFTGPGVSTSYSWLAKETKLAVAELSFDSIGNPKNFTWSSIPPLATSAGEAHRDLFQVYPQPASEVLNVDAMPGRLSSIALLALDGREAFRAAMPPSGRARLDVSTLPAGMYLLRPETLSGESLPLRKVLVR